MLRLQVLYPLLFAPLLVLHSTANNAPGGYSLRELVELGVVLLAATSALYIALFITLRKRWSVERIALIVMAVVIWFWLYVPLFDWVQKFAILGPRRTHALLLVLGGTATVVGVVELARRPRFLRRLQTFFVMVGTLLALWSGGAIVGQQFLNWRALRKSALVRELAVAVSSPSVASRPSRDIYLIVLDQYAGSEVLHEALGFDNSPFEDSLRQLGFTLPRLVHSNYPETYFSLPSLLNFSFIPIEGQRNGVPNYLTARNRAFAFLKSRGYRLVFVPSQWWFPTRDSDVADVVGHPADYWGSDQLLGCSRSQLARAFYGLTPLRFTSVCSPEADARYIRRTFDEIHRLSATGSPSFVFAHILSPHGPFVLDSSCRTHFVPGSRDIEARYLNQVQCVNRLVLDWVRDVLAREHPAPIVLLAGDHGIPFWGPKRTPLHQLPPSALRARFRTFGAFYLPGSGKQALGDSLSLVNVLPAVFNHYFGSAIRMLPNRMYLWRPDRPEEILGQGSGRLQEVDPSLMAEDR